MTRSEPHLPREATVVHELDVSAVIKLDSLNNAHVATAQEPAADSEQGLQLAGFPYPSLRWSSLEKPSNTRFGGSNECNEQVNLVL